MTFNLRRIAAFILIAMPLLGMAGCTGSDPLQPSNGNFDVQVSLVNTETRFESAAFTIQQISIRPVDPDADAILGPRDLGVLTYVIPVELNDPTTGASTVPLAAGIYELENLVLNEIFLADVDPPASTATCEEYITRYILTSPITPLAITDFGGTVGVTIDGGGIAHMTITIDGQAFVEAVQQSWACRQNCGGTIFPPSPPAPWCLQPLPSGFDTDLFVDLVPTYLSID